MFGFKRKTRPATSGPDYNKLGSSICTECGICCAGAIFGHAVMREGDDVEGLLEAGMAIYEGDDGTPEYLLPCPKLDGACCTIYQIRPTVCRKFQCQLLVSVKANVVSRELALEKVREAKTRIAEIKRMLREHGETSEHLPMVSRYLLLIEPHQGREDTEEFRRRFGPLKEAVDSWGVFRTEWFWDDNAEIVEED